MLAQSQIWGSPQASTKDWISWLNHGKLPIFNLFGTAKMAITCFMCILWTNLTPSFFLLSYPYFPFNSLFSSGKFYPAHCLYLGKLFQVFSEVKWSKQINTPKCFQMGFQRAPSCRPFHLCALSKANCSLKTKHSSFLHLGRRKNAFIN